MLVSQLANHTFDPRSFDLGLLRAHRLQHGRCGHSTYAIARLMVGLAGKDASRIGLKEDIVDMVQYFSKVLANVHDILHSIL